MKKVIAVAAVALLLAACAATPPMEEARYEVTCRTHAKTATYHGSPDEQGHFLECMKIKGRHDVVVSDIE